MHASHAQAVESTNKVVTQLSQKQVEDHFVPMIRRLTVGDWFTSRTSACGLYHAAYPLASSTTQEEFRKLFSQLCKDDTPMVRRAAATNLSHFVKCTTKDHLISDFLPLFVVLSQDEQDSVRLLTVDNLVAISSILSFGEVKTMVLNVLRSLCGDKSWRVRYMVAEKLVAVGHDSRSSPLTLRRPLLTPLPHLTESVPLPLPSPPPHLASQKRGQGDHQGGAGPRVHRPPQGH
jgi:serine/threonine-protein phosphatase 2A regulatory subunit A